MAQDCLRTLSISISMEDCTDSIRCDSCSNSVPHYWPSSSHVKCQSSKKGCCQDPGEVPGGAKPKLFVSNLWWHFSKGIINYCQLENVTQILLVWGANLVEMTKRDNDFHLDEWERKPGVLKWAISCVCSTPESSAPSQISATEKQRVTVSLEVTEKGDAWVNPSETVARIG